MIKIINNIYKEKCQNCQKCSPELTCTKFYGDNKVVTTVISVYCANCDICDEIELYLEGRKRNDFICSSWKYLLRRIRTYRKYIRYL